MRTGKLFGFTAAAMLAGAGLWGCAEEEPALPPADNIPSTTTTTGTLDDAAAGARDSANQAMTGAQDAARDASQRAQDAANNAATGAQDAANQAGTAIQEPAAPTGTAPAGDGM